MYGVSLCAATVNTHTNAITIHKVHRLCYHTSTMYVISKCLVRSISCQALCQHRHRFHHHHHQPAQLVALLAGTCRRQTLSHRALSRFLNRAWLGVMLQPGLAHLLRRRPDLRQCRHRAGLRCIHRHRPCLCRRREVLSQQNHTLGFLRYSSRCRPRQMLLEWT